MNWRWQIPVTGFAQRKRAGRGNLRNQGVAHALAWAAALLVQAPRAQDTKSVPVTIWDFNTSHPEFEGASCFGPAQGSKGIVTGLDAERKPTQTGVTTCPTADVNNWFRKSPPGEAAKSNARYCRDLEMTRKPGSANTYQIYNHLFFPIDDVPTREPGYLGDDKKEHNFNFCMEMHATFKYRGGEVFSMGGDDDIWAYINGKLVIDLGGVHRILRDSVSLDAQAAALGLKVGNFYPIDFFFCERQAPGSDLELTTSIDLIPPDPSGYSIADANKVSFARNDTVLITQGGAARTFYALEAKNLSTVSDCANLGTVEKNSVAADWSLDGKPLPRGTQISLDGTLTAGAHRLIMAVGAEKDTLHLRLVPYATLAPPIADPKGTAFSKTLSVTLSSLTPGVAIHYSLDGIPPTPRGPLYTGPIVLTGSATLQAIAVKSGWNESPVMIETYTRIPARAERGWYEDRDGDGRIETAVVMFNGEYQAPPASVHFTDPFAKTTAVVTAPFRVDGRTATYALFPAFAWGTGFPSADLGRIDADAEAFAAHAFPMDDSVGPVLKRAVAFPAGKAATRPALETDFSESLLDAGGVPAFPFDILRNGVLIPAAEVGLERAEALGPDRIRFVFAVGLRYPVPGDSLRFAGGAGIRDAHGNPARNRAWIRVEGEAATIADSILATLREPIAQGSVPVLTVTSRFPFSYRLAVFDNAGRFVRGYEGDIEDTTYARIRSPASPETPVPFALPLLPQSEHGGKWATGAYILKGEIRSRQTAGAVRGPQGEILTLIPARRSLLLRFGYLRHDHPGP